MPYEITGATAVIGRVLGIDEWASRAQIPNRKGPGVLNGEQVQHILGIQGKSWDPELFRRIETVIAVAQGALRSARMHPSDIDAAIVVTCTPYEVNLDQDSFRLLRALGIRDEVVPLQLGAGCAGLARAVAMASMLDARNVLVLTYNLASCLAGDGQGGVNPLYRSNATHPLAQNLWVSPGIFSDAAAAMILSRRAEPRGWVFYSRDSLSFGDGPGFKDPLIHVPGGGALRPPGTQGSAELSCFGMETQQVKRYYAQGMMLNHEKLLELRPDYVREVRRIYTHQAGPALVAEFAQLAGLPADKAPSNARELGNLVSPSTLKMLHDDLLSGRVVGGDEVCISVVGAGPERGAFLIGVNVREPVRVALPPPPA